MRLFAAIVFAGGLIGWTWALVAPNPVPPQIRELLGFWEHAAFVAAKMLHAGAYAAITAAGILTLPRYWKGIVALMMLHAIGTEIAQTFVPGRTGTIRDVLVDWSGVAAVLAVIKPWRA